MTKNERLQALIHRYKQETGEKAVDMEKIADWSNPPRGHAAEAKDRTRAVCGPVGRHSTRRVSCRSQDGFVLSREPCIHATGRAMVGSWCCGFDMEDATRRRCCGP